MSVQIQAGLGTKATQVNKLDGKRVKANFSAVGRKEGIGLEKRFNMLRMGRIMEKRKRQVAGT